MVCVFDGICVCCLAVHRVRKFAHFSLVIVALQRSWSADISMLTFLSRPSCRAPIVSIFQSVLEFDMTKVESNRCKLHLKEEEDEKRR